MAGGEVRPTSKPKKNVGKYWRQCPDPRLTVAAQLREWFDAGPWRTSRELLERLQGEQPETYPINCCERCSAVSKFGGGKTRIILVFGTTVPHNDHAQSPLQPVT